MSKKRQVRETFKAVKIGKRWHIIRTTKIGSVHEMSIRLPYSFSTRLEANARINGH